MRLTPRKAGTWAALVLVGGWITFIWAWGPSILTLTVDDSFYYFNTAVHAARGEGFTFDGIHPTNGFHPLWMYLLVPLARAFGSSIDTFARVVLTVQVLLVWGGTAVLVRTIAPRRGARSALFVMALFLNFYFAKVFVNGLESALQYACLCATIGCSWDLDDPEAVARAGKGRLVWLALLCAATTLARLSAGVFSVATLTRVALRAPRGRARSGPALALMVMVYGLPVAAYFVTNYRDFGHWLPVSAAIKGAYRGVYTLPLLVTIAAALAVLGLVSRVAPRAFPLAVYAGVQTTFDAGVRGVLVPEIWYLVPHAALALITVLMARRLAPAWSWTAVAVFASVTVWSWRVRLRSDSYSSYTTARSVGRWIEHNTDPRAIAAGWDCGIVGAYSRRRLVNLDGLINSWQYKEQYLDTGREQAFIDTDGRVDFIVQPVPLASLETDSPLFVDHGVDFSEWHLAHIECTTFRSVLARSDEAVVHLVLARAPLGPPMKSVVGPNARRLCADQRRAEAR